MPWILDYLKSRNGLKSKGNTIKKSAHLAQSRDGQHRCDRSDLETGDKDHIFPLGYYTPRPSPRGFVVREVRKVSSCKSPSECGTNQISAVDPNFGSIGTHHAAVPYPISACSSQISTSSAPSPDSSVKKVSHISPLIRQSTDNSKLNVKGAKANTHSRPAFNMLLGQQDPASSYFTRRYFRLAGLPASRNALDVSKNRIHCMSALDPHAFELFKLYTQTSKVAFNVPEDVVKEHLWMACWPLLNAHILGCTIEEPDFSDKVMDAIVYRLAPGTCPDVETITHLFTKDWEGVSHALRQFVIDRFIDAPELDREHLAVSDIPTSFSQLALQTALRCPSRASNAAVLSGCKYHIHGTKEACYKTGITPANALKEQKLAETREMSAKDAKVVVADVINNGVKSIDWAERRADANRTLRAETGRTWVGFERLEDIRVPKKSSGLIDTSANRTADGHTIDKRNHADLGLDQDIKQIARSLWQN
ncbi:hypothetical protein EJ07DRAFT_151921 [Lizonia empirigonia]|nr:hypothetical protein EJ07DRAFT_151921 [Lizonia empirigonia]